MDTPEELYEYYYDQFIWSWYLTCLPDDRYFIAKRVMPENVRILLTSPMIANLILTRWDQALRDRINGAAQLYNEVLKLEHMSRRKMSQYSKEERREIRQYIKVSREYFDDHVLRIENLPMGSGESARLIYNQAPWMYGYLAKCDNDAILKIADWYCESIK